MLVKVLFLLAATTPAVKHSAAVVVINKTSTNVPLAKKAEVAFVGRLSSLSGLHLVLAPDIKNRLKRSAEKAIEDCGTNLSCIAKLGAKLKVDSILCLRLINAKSDPSVVGFQLLDVGTKSQQIEHKASVLLANESDINDRLLPTLKDLFGGDERAPLAEASVAPPRPPTSAPAVTPARSPAQTGPVAQVIVAQPTTAATNVASKPTAPVSRMNRAPPMAAESGKSPRAELTAKAYIGAATAVVGIGLLAAGVGFGIVSANDRGQFAQFPGAQKVQLVGSANQAARTANGFFWAGGLTTALGAALIAWDFLTLHREVGPVRVAVSPLGAMHASW